MSKFSWVSQEYFNGEAGFRVYNWYYKKAYLNLKNWYNYSQYQYIILKVYISGFLNRYAARKYISLYMSEIIFIFEYNEDIYGV